MSYYSTDGSYLWAVIDPSLSWTVYFPDGMTVQNGAGGQRIRDANGNSIVIYSTDNDPARNRITTHYQDEGTGREIRYVHDAGGNRPDSSAQIQYPTVGGALVTIDLNFGATSVQWLTYNQLAGKDNNGPGACNARVRVDHNITVLRSIVLPETNGTSRQFTFTYNSDNVVQRILPPNAPCGEQFPTEPVQASGGWGSLSHMSMPSGASVDYTYNFDLILNPPMEQNPAQESITRKTLHHDGATDVWNYEIADGSERHWTHLNFRGENVVGPGGSILNFNPVVDAEYTTLKENGVAVMSAKMFQYDYNGNVTQETEYDWFDPGSVNRDVQGVPTGPPAGATVLRVTNRSYYNQASGPDLTNVYARRSITTGTPLILNALQETTVGASSTQFSYDNQAYGTPPTRGNLSRESRWDSAHNQWVTTQHAYDNYGNRTSTTDPLGHSAAYYYEDSTHALPTSVVSALNETVAQTTYTAYDYSTGRVTSQTDPNGNVTATEYTNQMTGAPDP
ncbi:MAG: hypothetical protein LAO21_23205, partial [Acidobacteriia bacterium]|nr:hypothetical protein [Terriglobia bacterium]